MSEAPYWRFSHFGLFVKDLDRMVLFYKQAFSLVETDGGEARGHDIKFLSRDPSEHHQLVLESSRKSDETTVQQISFRFGSLDGLREMEDRLNALPKDFFDTISDFFDIKTCGPGNTSDSIALSITFHASDKL